MTSIDRTAYPRFKRVVPGRELEESFTPTAEELDWAGGKTQSEQHRLSLLVLLKCYQRLGCFPKLSAVPTVVTEHVRGVLGVGEHVTVGHDAERTLWRHREFVRSRVGAAYRPREARRVAEAAIRSAVEAKDDPADLINVALDEVVRAGLELPGYSTFDKLATSVRTQFNAGVFTTVDPGWPRRRPAGRPGSGG